MAEVPGKTHEAVPQAVTMNRRGVDLTDAGKYREAEEAFGKALALSPDSPVILFNRGEARRLSGDAAGAKADLEAALRLDPGAADIRHALGLLAYEADDYDEALRWYGAALEAAPGLAEAWNDTGVVRFRRGDYPEARKAFEEAVRLDPESDEALFNLADTYDELGMGRERDRTEASLRALRARRGIVDGDED